MKFISTFLLSLSLCALLTATDVVGDFQIYVGSYDAREGARVVAMFGETPTMVSHGPRVAEEIQRTFNLQEIELLSAPRIVTKVGETGTIRSTYSEGVVQTWKMSFLVKTLEGDMATVSLNYAVDHGESKGAEFVTRLGKPISLASRLDGHVIFITATIDLNSKQDSENLPRILKKVAPAYPESMRKEGLTDLVVLRVLVTREGKTGSVEVLKAEHEASAQAARDAVRQWEWEPATENGKAIDKDFTVTLAFKLQ
ncbi:MAG TPA: energy transducer TonB [Thermoanaerobaculia bacterium]|nr:energy transducer TonB [Thermoanaerobaculia bacterium]HUM29636.1 energy transducer TonB [Thermoanaerobaculia bacterium]HXK67287.1 energy transducer TonB [Thermoanaerobaculia bacterium]